MKSHVKVARYPWPWIAAGRCIRIHSPIRQKIRLNYPNLSPGDAVTTASFTARDFQVSVVQTSNTKKGVPDITYRVVDPKTGLPLSFAQERKGSGSVTIQFDSVDRKEHTISLKIKNVGSEAVSVVGDILIPNNNK